MTADQASVTKALEVADNFGSDDMRVLAAEVRRLRAIIASNFKDIYSEGLEVGMRLREPTRK